MINFIRSAFIVILVLMVAQSCQRNIVAKLPDHSEAHISPYGDTLRVLHFYTNGQPREVVTYQNDTPSFNTGIDLNGKEIYIPKLLFDSDSASMFVYIPHDKYYGCVLNVQGCYEKEPVQSGDRIPVTPQLLKANKGNIVCQEHNILDIQIYEFEFIGK